MKELLIITVPIIPLLAGLVYTIAWYMGNRESEDREEEKKENIEKNAMETIQEAKKWIEALDELKETGGIEMHTGVNKHSLGELLALEPEKKDYEQFIEMIGERVEKLYQDFQFFLYEPDSADLVSGYLIQFQILGHEPVYNELFKLALDKGLDMDKIDDYFYDYLKEGKIFPIGDNIIIEREGTGVSPIKTGDDVRIIVSFVTEDYRNRQKEQEEADE